MGAQKAVLTPFNASCKNITIAYNKGESTKNYFFHRGVFRAINFSFYFSHTAVFFLLSSFLDPDTNMKNPCE
jgi:hypothetical protein